MHDQAVRALLKRAKAFERFIVVAEVFPGLVRKNPAREPVPSVNTAVDARVKNHQLSWILHREVLEHDGIGQSENRSVRANADGKRKDRDGREARIPLELPQAVPNVLPTRFQSRLPTDAPDFFFHRIHTAHFHPRRAQSFFLAQPRPHLVFHCGVQIAIQLFIHLVFDLFLLEKSPETGPETS